MNSFLVVLCERFCTSWITKLFLWARSSQLALPLEVKVEAQKVKKEYVVIAAV
jgi:hypothetical protein